MSQFFFPFIGLHSTLPGLSQGGPCGCAAAGQWPLPYAPHSKSPGQRHTTGTSSSLHLQLLRQQCLRLKQAERTWNETPSEDKATRRRYTLDENSSFALLIAREQRAWWDVGILKVWMEPKWWMTWWCSSKCAHHHHPSGKNEGPVSGCGLSRTQRFAHMHALTQKLWLISRVFFTW